MFQGLGALGVAAALAGCGGSDDSATDSSTGGADPQPSGSSQDPTGGGASGDGGSGGAQLATTSEVPVGGGIILADQQIVITQPTEGEFAAFTAICTHQGSMVSSVEEGTITCATHGSQFSAGTGEVETGPASVPLAEVPITVDGDKILAG